MNYKPAAQGRSLAECGKRNLVQLPRQQIGRRSGGDTDRLIFHGSRCSGAQSIIAAARSNLSTVCESERRRVAAEFPEARIGTTQQGRSLSCSRSAGCWSHGGTNPRLLLWALNQRCICPRQGLAMAPSSPSASHDRMHQRRRLAAMIHNTGP